jgi:DNA polymerase-3 subunit epsilon
MTLLKQEIFVCVDLETTGLDPKNDRIIEAAFVKFKIDQPLDSYETLIDPQCPIPEETIAIHHITNAMVAGKPTIAEILPILLKLIDNHIIVGHGIGMDIAFLLSACKQHEIPTTLSKNESIDTLRLARLYGESPSNSLETLRQHFNITAEGAHRAMSDVIVNIEVFKYLTTQFKTTKQILERLQKPIHLKAMPLGKHKGRPFSDIPIEYLTWAVHQDFDQDLLYSLKTELSKRKKGNHFKQATNPFSSL